MLQQTFMDSSEKMETSRNEIKVNKRTNENYRIENYKIKIKVSVCSRAQWKWQRIRTVKLTIIQYNLANSKREKFEIKNTQNFMSLWNSNKRVNICVIRISKGGKGKVGLKHI